MDERKEQLREAVDAIRDLNVDPDGAGGAVALEFLLGTAAPTPTPASPTTSLPTAVASATATPDGGGPLSAVAKWADVDALRLGDFIEFDGPSARLTIPSSRLPVSKADQQRILSLLILAANRTGLDAPQTAAGPIIAVIHDYAAFDQNFGGNLKKINSMVIRSGSPKDYVYKITQPGLNRAREIFRALCVDEDPISV